MQSIKFGVPNKPVHQTGKKTRPLVTGSDGADASRRAIGAAYYHPLAVRRFAPTIQRLQRTGVYASKLAYPPAADPRPRSAINRSIRLKFSELVRLLERNGFKIIKEKGSIRYYSKPGWDKLIRVDYHGSKEVPTGTCYQILKAAGIQKP